MRYFEGIVKLENVPGGLRPGMSAKVEIAMPRVENVLAVPSEAITRRERPRLLLSSSTTTAWSGAR